MSRFRGVMERLAAEEAGVVDVEAGASRLAGEQLTPVQSRAVDVLGSLLGLAVRMSDETQEAPAALKMLVLMLEKGRPLLVDGIAKVPDPVIVDFMRKLAGDIDSIVQAGGTDGSTGAELGTAAAVDSA